MDHDRAVIRARGHLDRRSADLLFETVLILQRNGHRHITVELAAAVADTGTRTELAGMVEQMSLDGTRLTMRGHARTFTRRTEQRPAAPRPPSVARGERPARTPPRQHPLVVGTDAIEPAAAQVT